MKLQKIEIVHDFSQPVEQVFIHDMTLTVEKAT